MEVTPPNNRTLRSGIENGQWKMDSVRIAIGLFINLFGGFVSVYMI
jgi:hypothetical protein